MKDYCDVLRTSRAGTPIEIEVLRFDTQEVLRGQVYGDGPIELAFSFAQEVGDVAPTSGAGYSGYTTLVDDTGTLTVNIPNEWSDTYTAPVTAEDGSTLPYIEASTDIATFEGSYSAPGIIFTVLEPQSDLDAMLEGFAPAPGDCTTDNGSNDYDDGLYAGRYRYWAGCGGDAGFVVLAAVPTDGAFTAVIAVQLLSDADWEALDQAFNSFFVITG